MATVAVARRGTGSMFIIFFEKFCYTIFSPSLSNSNDAPCIAALRVWLRVVIAYNPELTTAFLRFSFLHSYWASCQVDSALRMPSTPLIFAHPLPERVASRRSSRQMFPIQKWRPPLTLSSQIVVVSVGRRSMFLPFHLITVCLFGEENKWSIAWKNAEHARTHEIRIQMF